MPRTTALLLALCCAAVPIAGCGEEPQTAEQFCAEHRGVNQDTIEPDGDATCNDGTSFEADGDGENPSKKKKRKRR